MRVGFSAIGASVIGMNPEAVSSCTWLIDRDSDAIGTSSFAYIVPSESGGDAEICCLLNAREGGWGSSGVPWIALSLDILVRFIVGPENELDSSKSRFVESCAGGDGSAIWDEG